MDTFTMHDANHALKVAHLAWYVLAPARRERLTPPEIAMLVAAAFLHDASMFLSAQEREKRLSPDSDLWTRLEVDVLARRHLDGLRKSLRTETCPAKQERLHRRLALAEEALLCQDTRDRHSTGERYNQILAELRQFHSEDPERIPDIDSCLSFEGDTFRDKLVEICVSHGEPAEMLVSRDPAQPDRPRFSRDYPLGSATADLQMIAGVLRIADILDFDRERTPPVLYHYLLHGALDERDDRPGLEWSKHLAISNWYVDSNAVVFRGRCTNHVIHHAIVQFCSLMADEIGGTQATFGSPDQSAQLLGLPSNVKADIYEDGYRYIPYKFELDDERIYQLLMGGAIYENPLGAVRELVQNAVDACKLRDALKKLHEPEDEPNTNHRLLVEYHEPTSDRPHPLLVVQDTGVGMDEFVIRRWFLRVGQSYYSSAEFRSHRVLLRTKGLDFAPVSEFGIGFLSCFLLADRVNVETAMWGPIRGDTRKRTLEIDGPTRLIRLSEDANTGPGRFRGTRVTLTVVRGHLQDRTKPPTWEMIVRYLRNTCVRLPYRLHLRHVDASGLHEDFIDPRPITVAVPHELERFAVRIPVNDLGSGLRGEIALVHPVEAAKIERARAREMAAQLDDDAADPPDDSEQGCSPRSLLTRGGFALGGIPGLPESFRSRYATMGCLEMTWEGQDNRRYMPTNLSRGQVAGQRAMATGVLRIYMSWLLEHVEEIPSGLLEMMSARGLRLAAPDNTWLEKYDALTLYKLARNGWEQYLTTDSEQGLSRIQRWERGEGGTLGLWLFRSDLYPQMLDIVLPRVCTLTMGSQGRFRVTPPISGWEDALATSRDFIRNPVTWGYFVMYTDIDELLFYEYPGSDQLNARYRERVESIFNGNDLRHLIDGLRQLASSRQERQVLVSPGILSVLKRAQTGLGDLPIGNIHGKWRLDSFNLPA